jgi:hypothetical protein
MIERPCECSTVSGQESTAGWANQTGDESTASHAGIDVRKLPSQTAAVDENGCRLDEFRLRNDREGVEHLIHRV